jgi:hypothetical protein
MESMQAVVMRRTGGPEVLEPAEVPVPAPGPGQVLVRTEAIGVSGGETMMRSGRIPLPVEPPVVIGAEAVGTVERLGEGVDPSLDGTRLAVITGGLGSYAEFVTVDVAKTAPVPEGLNPVDAVAAAAPGAMALGLLHWAGLRAGDTVLVAPGSGKVGGYLIRHSPASAPPAWSPPPVPRREGRRLSGSAPTWSSTTAIRGGRRSCPGSSREPPWTSSSTASAARPAAACCGCSRRGRGAPCSTAPPRAHRRRWTRPR